MILNFQNVFKNIVTATKLLFYLVGLFHIDSVNPILDFPDAPSSIQTLLKLEINRQRNWPTFALTNSSAAMNRNPSGGFKKKKKKIFSEHVELTEPAEAGQVKARKDSDP